MSYFCKSASQAVITSVGCGPPFIRLTEHLTALHARCEQFFAWPVNTRHAPPRHCGDAKVCGHTTTAEHDMSTSRPPSPLWPLSTHFLPNKSICSCHNMEVLEANDNYLERLPAKLGEMKRLKILR